MSDLPPHAAWLKVHQDLEYLRERVDRIYDEVHKVRRTDWVAFASISGLALGIGWVVINLALAPISEKLSDHGNRLTALEEAIKAK